MASRRRRAALAIIAAVLMGQFVSIGGAAAADPAFLNVDREFTIDGPRTQVSLVRRVVDPSPNSSADTSLFLGPELANTTIFVALRQNGSDRASRMVQLRASGDLKNVSGRNCTTAYEPDLGVTLLLCERGGYDWRTDRGYRIGVARGNHTENGWLWTVRITDMQSGRVTQLGSFRLPYERLTARRHLATAYLETSGPCDSLNAFATKSSLPKTRDGTTSWGGIQRLAFGCETAELTAPIGPNNGVLLSIK